MRSRRLFLYRRAVSKGLRDPINWIYTGGCNRHRLALRHSFRPGATGTGPFALPQVDGRIGGVIRFNSAVYVAPRSFE